MNRRIVLISVFAVVSLWALFAHPLPRYFFSGIPFGTNPHMTDVEVMFAGDHLQLLYHFQLVGDMMIGETPWFHNLYEFNVGDDAARFQVEPYYIPFSMIYALGAMIGGPAFGWNLTGLISLWLTFLFTWLLVSRYTSSEWIAVFAAAVSLALPYRWISLLGGSPTGFAMMWVPMIWLGVDRAVRDESVRGGFLAGVAILFASWTDLHVFFFSVLTVPAWCLLALIMRGRWDKPCLEVFKGIFIAILPIIVFTAIAISLPGVMQWLTSLKIGAPPAADMVAKRTLGEVFLYSPGWHGFFAWRGAERWGEIYVGYSVLLFLALGGLALMWHGIRAWRKEWRLLLVFVLLIIGMAGIAILAMGMRAPFEGLFLRACRKLIPPYAMIRQTAKIFCLTPSFISVALGISLGGLAAFARWRGIRFVIVSACVLLIIREYAARINPHICLLEKRQGAYESVAENALLRGEPARAVVIPLWPGDAHYTALYQYFAMMYRIRMVNGYMPFVKRDYFENVFRRFESINQGDVSNEQIEALSAMGINAVIVHQDLFPEKVSPFPVAFTLRQLLNNPRLSLLKQDGPVWAFEILCESKEREDDVIGWDMFGAARRRDAQSCRAEQATVIEDPDAGGGAFLSLASTESSVSVRGVPAGSASDLNWMVRLRGNGLLEAILMREEREAERVELQIADPDWAWLQIPIQGHDSFAVVSIDFELQQGFVDIDTILLVAGRWRFPAPGDDLFVPASAFFHAGYINMERDSAVFLKDRHANRIVFYGPKLPLESAVYEVEILFHADVPDGTPLGWFNIRRRPGDPEDRHKVKAGERAIVLINHDQNLTISLELLLFRNADIEIDGVMFRREKKTD